MTIWQVDFYRRPLQDAQGHALWELLICDEALNFKFSAFCAQPEANSNWLVAQFAEAASAAKRLPELVQVFRPQTLSLVEAACDRLEIAVAPTRRTPALKQYLKQRSQQYPQMPGYTGQPYHPTDLDQLPPQPLPANLGGEQWQFAALPALELEEVLLQRPIPILNAPASMLPSQLQLAKATRVPGVVIYAGRQSLKLARWLEKQRPVFLQAIRGELHGLVLAAGLSDRWILVTFDDLEVTAAALEFERRKQISQGLHFLLVQPDDSGITFSGVWLLKTED